jgi:hypothetical protein
MTVSTAGSSSMYYRPNADEQICAYSTSAAPSSCGTAYTYDGNGNETTDPVTSNTYQYSLANDLTSINSGSTTSSTYDGAGNQLSTTAGGSTTYNFWDTNTPNGTAQLALEENGSGVVTKRYLYGLNRLSTTDISSGTTDYYAYDASNSVSNLITSSGAIDGSNTYSYNPYGGLRQSAPVPVLAFEGGSTITTVSSPSLYQSSDGSSAYDSSTGRSLTSQGWADGLNPYTAANDDPTAIEGYNPRTPSSSGVESISSLKCPTGSRRTRLRCGWNYFRSGKRSFSKAATAGILGNFWEESSPPGYHCYGMSSGCIADTSGVKAMLADGNISVGLGQWYNGFVARRDYLFRYASGLRVTGSTPVNKAKYWYKAANEGIQLQFTWYELHTLTSDNAGGTNAETELRDGEVTGKNGNNIAAVKDATDDFEYEFERAGSPHLGVRESDGRKVFNMFGRTG